MFVFLKRQILGQLTEYCVTQLSAVRVAAPTLCFSRQYFSVSEFLIKVSLVKMPRGGKRDAEPAAAC